MGNSLTAESVKPSVFFESVGIFFASDCKFKTRLSENRKILRQPIYYSNIGYYYQDFFRLLLSFTCVLTMYSVRRRDEQHLLPVCADTGIVTYNLLDLDIQTNMELCKIVLRFLFFVKQMQ